MGYVDYKIPSFHHKPVDLFISDPLERKSFPETIPTFKMIFLFKMIWWFIRFRILSTTRDTQVQKKKK